MDQATSKHRIKPFSDETDQKGKLLHAVNSVAEILLTAEEEEFEGSLWEAMELVALCMDIDRIYIWRNRIKDGTLQYIQHFGWPGDSDPTERTVRSNEGFSYAESIPEWEEKFLAGECVNGPLSKLSQTEQNRLEPYGIRSILVVPVHLQDRFWGFVSFDDCHQERTFTEDEISILRSANLMLASALDRHETTARIREADEHAKLMLDATPLCGSLWDREFNIINCNEAVIKLFGLKDKQEYIDRFNDLLPEYQPDGRLSVEKATEMISTAFSEGRIVFEWMHRTLSGELIPMEVTLVRVRRGDEFIVAGYARDLREHKKMMRAIGHKDTLLHTVNEAATILLQSEIEEFEDNLLRCMGMMADSVNADRMYIWKNYEKDGQLYTSQLYEWSEGAQPQQGREYTVDVPFNAAPHWTQELSAGQCINGIVRLLSEEEQVLLEPQGVLSILVVPVFLRDRYWGFVGFDDCHRERFFSKEEETILRSGSLLIAHSLLRNEMTHEIQAAVKRAQAASNAKSAFLAHMSHEIRTPMNVIAGMTELILREDAPAAIHENLLSIKHASANMLSLINDILDFSKIEAGSLNIVLAEYSLTSLINNILNIIRMKVSEKPILFTTNIDCNIPNRLIGDEARTRQILLNVLDNAVKYTNEGFVCLKVTGEIRWDTVVLTAEVSDSGVGVKEENIDKMFDDFIRFDGEMNKSVQGTGLGLAITKRLCQAMGGNISVRSEYGVGSAFTITLPQKIKSHSEKFAAVSNPGKKQILLYETRQIYADSIARSLDNLGVCCTSVKNRKEFYEALRRGNFPFIFASSLVSDCARQAIGELKLDTTLVLITGFGETPAMRGIRTISTPVHSASIANILDDIEDNAFYLHESGRKRAHFIAPSANVLIVDDLNTNLKVAQGLLLPYQMQVDVCESGEEAVEYVQRKRYDVIFMDHMMQGMNGIEATGRIRSLKDKSGYYQSVPIIALTANAVSGVKEMFMRNGMNDFLAKPIDISKLNDLLEKYIPPEKKVKLRKARAVLPSADLDSVQIERVDVKAGIDMAGGTLDAYLKTLDAFHADGLDKVNRIRDWAVKNDIRQYTICVHALKSASAAIGAWEMSDFFKILEMAGTSGDMAFIQRNNERTLKEFETLLKNIHDVISRKRGKPARENDPVFIRNKLLKLREALNKRDAGEVDDIMDELAAVKWDRQTGGIFEEISRNILLINYTNASALLDKILIN